MFETNTIFSESEKDHIDSVAKNIIVSALDSNEFLRVSKCVSAKDMWDTLERIHKDSRNAWLDNDKFSSGSSSAASKINLCLMAKEDSASNSVSTSSSAKCDSYYQLLEAFKEAHEEAHKLTFSNNSLKSKNNWLKIIVKVLEKDLNNSKTDFENIEMIYQNSSCKCESSFCKNCESLQKNGFIL